MSRAYNNRKKARKRAMDLANPDRCKYRRMIRQGLIPKFAIYVQVTKHWKMPDGSIRPRKTEWVFKSTFKELTAVAA